MAEEDEDVAFRNEEEEAVDIHGRSTGVAAAVGGAGGAGDSTGVAAAAAAAVEKSDLRMYCKVVDTECHKRRKSSSPDARDDRVRIDLRAQMRRGKRRRGR